MGQTLVMSVKEESVEGGQGIFQAWNDGPLGIDWICSEVGMMFHLGTS